MKRFLDRIAEAAHLHALPLLFLFVLSVLAINWGRWSGWDLQGLRQYLTLPIMQTTLYDFAWVLAILTLFIHQDAKQHGLRYWYVFPTYPFMPTVGLLLYLWIRQRTLAARGTVPPLGS